jgi:hypothetical protein
MRPKKWLSAQEHEAVARKLLRVSVEMERLGTLVLETYGVSTRLGKQG